uniref:Retrotrans_gag domain-containing protein n=1 Tax=Heterorhabditis bacteriophora TaxID=37862 RepID=A0A1I7WQ34_HETBA
MSRLLTQTRNQRNECRSQSSCNKKKEDETNFDINISMKRTRREESQSSDERLELAVSSIRCGRKLKLCPGERMGMSILEYEEAQYVHFIPKLLVGRASAWLELASEDVCSTWPNLKSALIAEFTSSRVKERARRDLIAVTKKTSESMLEFVARIKRLAKLVYGEENDIYIVDFVVRGLPLKLQDKIRHKQTTVLSELINIVERYEAEELDRTKKESPLISKIFGAASRRTYLHMVNTTIYWSSSSSEYSFPLLGCRCTRLSTYFVEYGTVSTFDESSILTDLTEAIDYERYTLHRNQKCSLARKWGAYVSFMCIFIPVLLKQYDSIFKEQLLVDPTKRANGSLVHYLPHHPVINLHKASTKMSTVYDASAKTKNNCSLNDCLYRGPVLLPDLSFLQLNLAQPDREVTRFLWIHNLSQPPSPKNLVTYRFARVPFGKISSPFLLGQHESPISKQLWRNLYVDNVFLSASTFDEAKSLYFESKEIFSDASMNLREFISNNEAFNQFLQQEGNPQQKSTKILGIKWNNICDILSFSLPTYSATVLTKRSILKFIASIYDPLGLISPILVLPKLLLQKLWKTSLSWDDDLTNELEDEWFSIIKNWDNQIISVKRLIDISHSTPIRPHCFVDASGHTYGAVAYLRMVDIISQNISTRISFSKNRLCPIKEMTIPKLELMALVIGASKDLTVFIKNRFPSILCSKNSAIHKILQRYIDSTPVTPSSRRIATLYVFKISQNIHPPPDHEINELRLHRDELGIWRAQSRLDLNTSNYDIQFPVYLNRSCHITSLFILNIHNTLTHSGTTTTLANLR